MKLYTPKILFGDIETAPVPAYVWRLGDQAVRHTQLVRDKDGKVPFTQIICISYAWNDGKPPKTLVWDKNHSSKKMIQEFDKLVKKADIFIGKNSDRFDNKHINTHRMLQGLEGMPWWTRSTDDIEKQMRKHFNLQSYSLDYFADLLGVGQKSKMEWQDWIDIVERDDPKKLKKMIKYCEQDVKITRAIYNKIVPYITPKLNASLHQVDVTGCRTCGSSNLVPNGSRVIGNQRYRKWECLDHEGYAGLSTYTKTGKRGKLQ